MVYNGFGHRNVQKWLEIIVYITDFSDENVIHLSIYMDIYVDLGWDGGGE